MRRIEIDFLISWSAQKRVFSSVQVFARAIGPAHFSPLWPGRHFLRFLTFFLKNIFIFQKIKNKNAFLFFIFWKIKIFFCPMVACASACSPAGAGSPPTWRLRRGLGRREGRRAAGAALREGVALRTEGAVTEEWERVPAAGRADAERAPCPARQRRAGHGAINATRRRTGRVTDSAAWPSFRRPSDSKIFLF